MMPTLENRLKGIMGKKEVLGEFSLDLYYNDSDRLNPCTAKITYPQGEAVHFRGTTFDDVLSKVEYTFYCVENLINGVHPDL